MQTTNTSWIASQIGFRDSYCAARALLRLQCLERMYTDVWVPRGHSVLRHTPRKISDLQNRYHPELRHSRVHSFLLSLSKFFLSAGRSANKNSFHLAFGEAYDKLVAQHLERNPPGKSSLGGVITYTSGGLETLRVARSMGLRTVLDQIDPALTELRIVREEIERWPDWEESFDAQRAEPKAYWDRVREEWSIADLVIVNSEFSRQALIEQGADPAKLIVIPLAYERHDAGHALAAKPNNAKLTVFWIGNVIIRKGIQYLRDAARLLSKMNIEFVVAGPIGINPDRLRDFPPNVTFLGKLSGEKKAAFFRQSDLFILPTVSDGFAITQIEAMAAGLPVIATPNCGDVVTDGIDGYIIPIRNSEALAQKIETLYSDRNLLRSMSEAALRKSAQFSIDQYAENLRRHIIHRSDLQPAAASAAPQSHSHG